MTDESWPKLSLPIVPPYPPMEAKAVKALPKVDAQAPSWTFEPKWDGFRCLAFRDGDTVALQSKAGQPLTRYFPEIVEAVLAVRHERFVLDGELVVPSPRGEEHGLDFDALLQRVHPAASRVAKLSRETPAVYQVFDLLVSGAGGVRGVGGVNGARGADGESVHEDGHDGEHRPTHEHVVSWIEAGLEERRAALETFLKDAKHPIVLSPSTTDPDVVEGWQRELRNHGIDGLVAKRLGVAYASGERTGMQKKKWIRTADCVVGGFRYGTNGGFGSLLLGLFDEAGKLDHVGFCSAFPAADKPALLEKVEALRGAPGFTGKAPGGPSRWNRGKNTDWQPLRTELVVEVEYDHASGGRFRHGTKFVRFRPDKAPAQCTRATQMRGGGAPGEGAEESEEAEAEEAEADARDDATRSRSKKRA